MSDKTIVHNHGVGIAGWLGIIFVTLKLCGIITWPWIWVLAPFWIGIVLLLALLAFPIVLFVAAGVFAILGWIIGLLCSVGKRK